MNLWKKKLISFLITLIAFIIICVTRATCNTTIILIVSVLAVVGLTALDILWIRCPHCHEYLGRYHCNAPYCKHCGEKLED